MRREEIDLDRAVNDPEYRREVIRRLNAEAQRTAAPGEPQRLGAEAAPERKGGSA